MAAIDFRSATANSRNDWFDSSRNHRKKRSNEHRLMRVVKSKKGRYIPWGSVLALLVTWIGLYLFSYKLYIGMQDLEEQSQGLFKFLVPHLQTVKQATVITAFVMTGLTAMMALVGFCATMHCDHCYRGRLSTCVCGKLGSRVMCGLFWFLSYLMNLCWMIILSFMVVMTSAYFAFMPVCLPQAGTVDTFCLNFTILSNLMTPAADANSVNLLLCGGAIDKLCKLTKAIVPWYWGAYLGCLAVLLGLSHFNGSLAANFAHGKHAVRYVKIRDRTSPTIEWTKDWRVKSVLYFDVTSGSAVSLRKKTIKPVNGALYSPDHAGVVSNGHVPNGLGKVIMPGRPGSTTCSDAESQSEDDEIERSSRTMDLKSSNSSIVLSVQRNGDVRKVLALPPPPPSPKMNGALERPPVPPYKPRLSSSHSEHSLNNPAPAYKSRPASTLSTQPPALPGNGYKEVRV